MKIKFKKITIYLLSCTNIFFNCHWSKPALAQNVGFIDFQSFCANVMAPELQTRRFQVEAAEAILEPTRPRAYGWTCRVVLYNPKKGRILVRQELFPPATTICRIQYENSELVGHIYQEDDPQAWICLYPYPGLYQGETI